MEGLRIELLRERDDLLRGDRHLARHKLVADNNIINGEAHPFILTLFSRQG